MSKAAAVPSIEMLNLIPKTGAIIIGLDTQDGPDHPLWDERIKLALEDTDIAHVKIHGVLEPIVVCRSGAEAEWKLPAGSLVVLDGKQRMRWARSAGVSRIAARLIEAPTLKAAYAVLIGLNEHRRNDGILEKLAKAKKLLSLGGTEKEVAIEFGVSVTAVKQWLAVDKTTEKVKQAVAKGAMTATAAIALAKLPREKQDAAAEQAELDFGSGRTTKVRDAKTAAKKAGASSESVMAPKKLLRALQGCEALNSDMRMLLSWILGEAEADMVPTLEDALEALEEEGE